MVPEDQVLRFGINPRSQSLSSQRQGVTVAYEVRGFRFFLEGDIRILLYNILCDQIFMIAAKALFNCGDAR